MTALLPILIQAAALAGDAGWSMAALPVASPQEVAASDSVDAQLKRARSLATSGDPAQRDQALVLYGQMLERSPDNSDVLLARGRTFAWMGRYPESEADLAAVTAHSPENSDAWSALGDMYLWSDRPQLAAQAYDHWVALKPADPAASIARGRAHRAAGEAEAARADFAAAQAGGADAGVVARLLESTQPRIATPESVLSGDFNWLLRAGYGRTAFSGGRADWNDADLSLRRRFARGSLALEWLQADHFGSTDSAWALDGYAALWSRAYANARYQHGPGNGVLPSEAWRVELFQGVGRGWELSASVDHLRFSSDTEFYGIGVGRYVGNWYMRYKLQHVPGAGSGSWSHRALLRNYYRGDADDYFEVSAGSGRSTDLNRFGGVVRDSSASLGVAWVHFVQPRWGFKLGAGVGNDQGGFNERSVSVALYTRW